jgi:hypothetical protein
VWSFATSFTTLRVAPHSTTVYQFVLLFSCLVSTLPCKVHIHHTVTEPARPTVAVSVPVSEPPRAPQPEAPIDPVECRLYLLDHIDHFQTQIDTRLTMLEEQVAGWCCSLLALKLCMRD